MNILIVIPARGGSKGIPKKNIYLLRGKPLIGYTIEAIQKANLKDADVVVSTDSEEIKQVALSYEGIVVVDRPAELSGDRASTEGALLHAIDYMETTTTKKYDAVMTMQPTSPLRNAATLIDFVEAYKSNCSDFDAYLSLTEDRTDFWICDDSQAFHRLYPNAPRRRQERCPIYRENSAYYITDVAALRKTHSVLGTKANGFVIPESEGIDINEKVDLIIAEAFLDNCT